MVKIYEVVPKFSGSSYVVIAKNASEAIEIEAKYLNRFQTSHLFKTSEFYVRAIGADKFSEPTIIF